MGEEIKAIDGLCRCDKAIGVAQGDNNTVERRLLIGILHPVAIGIQIDKIANRPQCLEGDDMTGPVVTGDGIADGVSVGGVGDRLRTVRSGAHGDNSSGIGQERAHCTSKRAAGQVATATGHGIEDNSARLRIGNGDAGDGDAGGVAHSEEIVKGCADGDSGRAAFGNGDITLDKLTVVSTGRGRSDRAIGAGKSPLTAGIGIGAILDRSNALPTCCAGWCIGRCPVGTGVNGVITAISDVIKHSANGVAAAV
jgi:hypothetical protein